MSKCWGSMNKEGSRHRSLLKRRECEAEVGLKGPSGGIFILKTKVVTRGLSDQ